VGKRKEGGWHQKPVKSSKDSITTVESIRRANRVKVSPDIDQGGEKGVKEGGSGMIIGSCGLGRKPTVNSRGGREVEVT
jgi:hypothetical protein